MVPKVQDPRFDSSSAPADSGPVDPLSVQCATSGGVVATEPRPYPAITLRG